jgi:hypothetical protein
MATRRPVTDGGPSRVDSREPFLSGSFPASTSRRSRFTEPPLSSTRIDQHNAPVGSGCEHGSPASAQLAGGLGCSVWSGGVKPERGCGAGHAVVIGDDHGKVAAERQCRCEVDGVKRAELYRRERRSGRSHPGAERDLCNRAEQDGNRFAARDALAALSSRTLHRSGQLDRRDRARRKTSPRQKFMLERVRLRLADDQLDQR